MKATTMKATNMQATKNVKKPSRSSGKSPLDQRLLAYALGGGALALAATPAEAAVIWSGIQNVSVPSLGGGTGTNQNSGNFSYIPLFPENPSSPQFDFGWSGDSDTGDSQIFGAIVDSNGGLSGFICTGAPVSFNNFTLGQTFGPTSPAKDWTDFDPKATPKTKGNKSTVFPNYNVLGVFPTTRATIATILPPVEASPPSGAFRFRSGSPGQPATQASCIRLEAMPTTVGRKSPCRTLQPPDKTPRSCSGLSSLLPTRLFEIGATTSVPEIDPASGGSALALLVGGLALVEQQVGFAAGAAGLRAWRKRRQSVSQS